MWLARYRTGKEAHISVSEAGEFGLIARITARLPAGPAVLLGPGDDAAVVAAADGRVVVTTDMAVEGRHFRLDWMDAYDVGRKTAAANLADVAAMGAVPTAIVVALGCPGSYPATQVEALADGLRDECALVSASVVGGDVVAAERLVVAITALGDLGGRPPVTRAGARPGDRVVLAGRTGAAAAGLRALRAGRLRAPEAAAYRRPEPPYRLGPLLAAAGATAMIDVSDGLVADLGHLAEASGVAVEIDVAAVGGEPELTLTGGDDHALAATVPPGAGLPAGVRVIGTVRAGPPGVLGVPPEIARRPGYAHFGEAAP